LEKVDHSIENTLKCKDGTKFIYFPEVQVFQDGGKMLAMNMCKCFSVVVIRSRNENYYSPFLLAMSLEH
jgi:hypothetical protein